MGMRFEKLEKGNNLNPRFFVIRADAWLLISKINLDLGEQCDHFGHQMNRMLFNVNLYNRPRLQHQSFDFSAFTRTFYECIN